MPDTMLSYGVPLGGGTPLDTVALQQAADVETNEIYRLHLQLAYGLDLLRELTTRCINNPDSRDDDLGKVTFALDALNVTADGILKANDRLVTTLAPLNPNEGP